MVRGRDPLEGIVRKLGQPSWLILAALDPAHPLAGTQIIDRVETLLTRAEFPQRTLDPSTLHYALKRLGDDGLVKALGKREVDVPGPHGTTHRALRDVYVLSGEGLRARAAKARLDTIVQGLPAFATGRA